jgi:hypothetical protein
MSIIDMLETDANEQIAAIEVYADALNTAVSSIAQVGEQGENLDRMARPLAGEMVALARHTLTRELDRVMRALEERH